VERFVHGSTYLERRRRLAAGGWLLAARVGCWLTLAVER